MEPYDYLSQLLRTPRWRAKTEAAFWPQVDRRSRGECWPWLGRKRGRYGVMACGYGYDEAAHRLAYTFHNNRSPFPLLIRHSCDTPLCCNPQHLGTGDHVANADDMMRRGRHRPSPQPGEKNPRARLSEVDVARIRERIVAGETNVSIAKDYPVSHAMVSLIRRGKAWAG